MADEPILLVLVRGVLHVIGWICSIFAFPTVACLAGLSPIVINDAFKADSGQPLAQAVLAPFRFILGLVTLVLLSTLWVPATAYFVLRGGSDVVGLVIASSVAALFLQVRIARQAGCPLSPCQLTSRACCHRCMACATFTSIPASPRTHASRSFFSMCWKALPTCWLWLVV